MKMLSTILFLAALASAQRQHGRSVEQCKADGKVWAVEKDVSTVTAQTLAFRMRILTECSVAYPEDGDNPNWLTIIAANGAELSGRQTHFLDRHAMLKQFLAEDAAGKR
jgi:hypothetical protein